VPKRRGLGKRDRQAQPSTRVQAGKQIEKAPRGYDPNPLVLANHEHVIIARDEIVGLGRDRAGDYLVITWIAGDLRHLGCVAEELG
jgi:hypothetical protein